MAAGERESREESFGGLGTIIILTVFGLLAILILEFRTFKSTIIVLSVIPMGIIGALVALYITGESLSFVATVGIIALIGIEIKIDPDGGLYQWTKREGYGTLRSCDGWCRNQISAYFIDFHDRYRWIDTFGSGKLTANQSVGHRVDRRTHQQYPT